jgi:hypothetical protein
MSLTQSILFENSEKVPEGLYIDLMNSLKKDFETATKKPGRLIVIINRTIPSRILMTKKELLQSIVNGSRAWPDREAILLKIVTWSYGQLRALCRERNINDMKTNPKWHERTPEEVTLRNTALSMRSGGSVLHM